ncbi:EI24 domain-containing protein [Actinorugispora endophytica]|uniref:CysZ protein n=1 Tax=Actinorugispora endophytica TaxID=1605990 RepID=A0A4R6VAJ2_9ACTN|nr:EI24 domain-containing protein [Actinorugispora endophytica]TDQ53657.1 CysZ protein [Actinorugispora endophytica]
MTTPLREILTGIGTLFRGFGLILRRPRLFLLGAIPPLITSVLFLAALIALIARIDELVVWMTPFTATWNETWAGVLQAAIGVAVVGSTVLVMVIGFTTITLALGFPLYDKIAEDVEDELGGAPPPLDEPLAASVVRALRQSVALILISVAVAIPLFLAGFIPFVGQTVVPVASALFGGWMLCAELVGTAFDRRGLRRLRDRFAGMRTRRLRVLGFAVPAFLLLSIPFVAVVVFPAATAGGTILARSLTPRTPPAPEGPAHPSLPGGQV